MSRRPTWSLSLMAVLLLAGCTSPVPALTVTSAALVQGEPVPEPYTCDGQDRSPPLTVTDLPAGTLSVAIILDDPDAPRGTFTHWVLWNVPASGGVASLPEGRVPAGAVEGANDAGGVGYVGPCPPAEDGAHRYHIRAYAVDRAELDLEAGADRAELDLALAGHVLGEGEMIVTYDR